MKTPLYEVKQIDVESQERKEVEHDVISKAIRAKHLVLLEKAAVESLLLQRRLCAYKSLHMAASSLMKRSFYNSQEKS